MSRRLAMAEGAGPVRARHRAHSAKGATAKFRAFLVKTFGAELMSEGSGVLDVAGGRGQLSFELLNTPPCVAPDRW